MGRRHPGNREQHILLLHPLPRRVLLPEVRPADVGHPGTAHGAGLDEVLGGQNDGLDTSLHRHLVVLHREGAEQAGSPRQVCAPAPVTEPGSLPAHGGLGSEGPHTAREGGDRAVSWAM